MLINKPNVKYFYRFVCIKLNHLTHLVAINEKYDNLVTV